MWQFIKKERKAIWEKDEWGIKWEWKLFWKEIDKVNGGEEENFNRINNRTERLVLGKDELRKTWKEYFENV